MDYGSNKITQHALKVSVFIMLKLDTTPKKKKKNCRKYCMDNLAIN